jgi:heme-degrading monooxygenase HmoA
MAVLRLDRFTIDPADTAELLTRHAALVAAAKDNFPGLLGAQLAKIDDESWLTVWRWDSLASAKAAVGEAPSIPGVGAAFSLTKDLTVEFAEVIDAR